VCVCVYQQIPHVPVFIRGFCCTVNASTVGMVVILPVINTPTTAKNNNIGPLAVLRRRHGDGDTEMFRNEDTMIDKYRMMYYCMNAMWVDGCD
jgi:hypothetical protein